MDFFVYSRQMIEAIRPHEEGHLIISIRTPGDPKKVRLPRNHLTYGVLELQFHDIVAASQEVEDIIAAEGKYLLFNESMAKDILNFVKTSPLPNRIIVHCDAGVSRSPAVAAGICKTVYGEDDSWFFNRYHPNRRVYRCILNAHANETTS